jgi:hypothetical protein
MIVVVAVVVNFDVVVNVVDNVDDVVYKKNTAKYGSSFS